MLTSVRFVSLHFAPNVIPSLVLLTLVAYQDAIIRMSQTFTQHGFSLTASSRW